MANMFDELVSIKEFREDKAERVMVKQRTVLQDATVARDKAERKRDDYRAYAKNQETSLYQGLCGKVVQMRDISDVQDEIAAMRAEEARHEEQAKKAEAQREKEAKRLDEDRRALREANRMKEKFVELAQDHARQMLKEFERKEEAELEEVAEMGSARRRAGEEASA